VRERGPEPFNINSGDWNTIVDFLRDNLHLICPGSPRDPKVPHPWKLNLRWDDAKLQWVFSVRPGFVRGHDVYMTTSEDLISEKTAERLGLKEEGLRPDVKVSVPLTETPEMAIPSDMWRAVATESSIRFNSASRAVPRSIQERYNTIKPAVVTVTQDDEGVGSIETDVSEALEQDRETARCAFCIDLVLRQPRASVALAPPQEGPDPNYLELFVRYVNPKDDPPYVELTTEGPEELEAQEQVNIKIALASDDPGYDTLPLATIWMLGPAGELYADEVDESWQPIVEYHTFYNLDHTLNVEIKNLPPLRQLNPAAGLLTGFAVQAAVEIINETNRLAEQLYQQVIIKGKFWTV
jgi:hypothetical protein